MPDLAFPGRWAIYASCLWPHFSHLIIFDRILAFAKQVLAAWPPIITLARPGPGMSAVPKTPPTIHNTPNALSEKRPQLSSIEINRPPQCLQVFIVQFFFNHYTNFYLLLLWGGLLSSSINLSRLFCVIFCCLLFSLSVLFRFISFLPFKISLLPYWRQCLSSSY